METEARTILERLILENSTAALGTLRMGAPEVTMVVYAHAKDFSAFYLHTSRLAHHTQNIQKDSRVSLMIAEPATPERNPQSLARVSIQGDARVVSRGAEDYQQVKTEYLSKFPQAEMMFGLGDFELYAIEPKTARFVAGFAQAYNLTLKDFRELTNVNDQ